jgi:hypothetical protein
MAYVCFIVDEFSRRSRSVPDVRGAAAKCSAMSLAGPMAIARIG